MRQTSLNPSYWFPFVPLSMKTLFFCKGLVAEPLSVPLAARKAAPLRFGCGPAAAGLRCALLWLISLLFVFPSRPSRPSVQISSVSVRQQPGSRRASAATCNPVKGRAYDGRGFSSLLFPPLADKFFSSLLPFCVLVSFLVLFVVNLFSSWVVGVARAVLFRGCNSLFDCRAGECPG